MKNTDEKEGAITRLTEITESTPSANQSAPTTDDREDQSAPPQSSRPDGGYGWVVVFACVFGHFLMVGIARVFGVFYVVLLEKFGGTAQATAWVHALYNTTRMLTGPIVSRLCERYTCRKVVIVGGIIQGVGCIVSAFATHLVYLYFSYGLLTGIGGGLIFTPMLIAISQYFEKKKGKAMALATLGSGLGSVALAPLATLLLREYSWTGAMLIMGALMFHCCAVGGLLRPLPTRTTSRTLEALPEVEQRKHNDCCGRMSRVCKESEGLSLLRNPTYLLYCLSIMCLPFITQLTFLMIPSHAKECGLTSDQAALILAMMGISDMTGRFFHGAIFDLEFIRAAGRRRLLYCLLGMTLACVNATFALQTSFAGFMVVALFWGLTESGFHGQRATIQGEFIPQSQIAKSVGNMIFCQGVGNLLAPTTGGWLVDAFMTYRVVFFYGGAVTFTGSFLFLLDYLFGAKLRHVCGKDIRST